MKILLVCNGGMSTSILMNNIVDYAEQNDLDITANAYGLTDYDQYTEGIDVCLLGPQIAYKLDELKNEVDVPCLVVKSFDYATGNVANILKEINEALTKKEN